MVSFKHLRSKYPYVFIILSILAVVGLATLVFMLRYKEAFTIPNFYAEDGEVFLQNIFDHNAIGAALTPFNGYLVVGQYLIADIAFLVYLLFDLPFYLLPSLLALASCIFLGLTVSLPFILFRKQLGILISLAVVGLGAFVPMIHSDYAIIGTIGNLKFAFMYWAFLLVIYRNLHFNDKRKVIATDFGLLLCVLTSGPAALLLPFNLWPYRAEIAQSIKKRQLTKKVLRPGLISSLALLGVSFIYVVAVYLHGIPEMPGYLDTAYQWQATFKILYRVTVYPFLFPFNGIMNDYLVACIFIVLLGAVVFLNKKGRKVFLFGLFVILLTTVSFVMTRPGVSAHMLIYIASPDQFFYAQNLVFIFMVAWVARYYLMSYRRELLFLVGAGVFIVLTAHMGSSWGKNKVLYQDRGSAYTNVSQQCGADKNETIRLPIYPAPNWNWELDRKIACE